MMVMVMVMNDLKIVMILLFFLLFQMLIVVMMNFSEGLKRKRYIDLR